MGRLTALGTSSQPAWVTHRAMLRAPRFTDLDVAARVEAVQLVDNLQHRPLHLVVAALPVIEASAADGIHLQRQQHSTSDVTNAVKLVSLVSLPQLSWTTLSCALHTAHLAAF